MKRLAAGAISVLLMASAANAADLVIALKSPPTTVDPHYMVSPPTTMIDGQIFEPLVLRDNENKIQPMLAERWELVNDTTWLFHLRKGVKFTDGTPFTADDVVFSFNRPATIKDSPASYASYLSQIAKIEAVDANTVRITTKGPAPTLLENICIIQIVSRKHGENATTADYTSGKAMIGTGPYKFVSWVLNDNTVIQKAPSYWGKPATWDKITYKIITNDASRVAALLAGDVDVIESVPSQDIARLKADLRTATWTSETSRIIYIVTDAGADMGTRVTGPNGEKLDKSPLADRKVREAMRLAIDVPSIIERIYQGEATASNQFLSKKTAAYNPDIPDWKMDQAKAKQLLAESGWAGKFKLDIVASPTNFQYSVELAQALAQFWTRIGIPTSVTNLPYPVFLKQRTDRQMPVYVVQFQNSAGIAELFNMLILHTREPEKRLGSLNFSYYSNASFDKIMEEAVQVMDAKKRNDMLREAAAIVDKDGTLIPLFLMSETTGTKKSLNFKARIDRLIYPADITSAK